MTEFLKYVQKTYKWVYKRDMSIERRCRLRILTITKLVYSEDIRFHRELILEEMRTDLFFDLIYSFVKERLSNLGLS